MPHCARIASINLMTRSISEWGICGHSVRPSLIAAQQESSSYSNPVSWGGTGISLTKFRSRS